jgi:hypothetical protein
VGKLQPAEKPRRSSPAAIKVRVRDRASPTTKEKKNEYYILNFCFFDFSVDNHKKEGLLKF